MEASSKFLPILSLTLITASASAQSNTPRVSTPAELTGELLVGKEYSGKPVPAPIGLDGKPDLTGYWKPIRVVGKPGGNMGKNEPKFILPFTEAGKRALLYTQNHTVDPEAVCILGGIPRHNASGLPFEILHTPQRLATLYLYNTHRWVTIGDGAQHYPELGARYFGDAIAHWEGNTLVIETNNLRDSAKDQIWLDENGNPTSDQTTVVERWTRPDFHHLSLEMTIIDPKYYTRPIKFDRTWVAGQPGEGQNEYACNENNLDAEHIGPGAGVIGPDGNRGYGYEDLKLPVEPPSPEAYGQ